jgi:hypothetical protein
MVRDRRRPARRLQPERRCDPDPAEMVLPRPGVPGALGGQLDRQRQPRSRRLQDVAPVRHGGGGDPVPGRHHGPVFCRVSGQTVVVQHGPYPVQPERPEDPVGSSEISADGVDPGSGTPSRMSQP